MSVNVSVTPPGEGSGVNLEDFLAHLPSGAFIFTPCRETWVASSINTLFPKRPRLDKKTGQPKLNSKGKVIMLSPTDWLIENQAVTQMTWAPGEPMEIRDRMVVDGGWIKRKDMKCLNMYRPARAELGDANAAGLWIDHVHKLFVPNEADHTIKWLAQRVQHPEIKINHALVLGGAPGVGKDTLLEPVKYAVGPWNFHEISPTHLLGNFNSYAKSVILRISEARDLGDVTRFAFYDKTKTYIAAPPDTLPVNEKYLKLYYMPNCIGCVITTNYKTDGIYLPPDDRRHFIAWTDCVEADFAADYWDRLWSWYANGGMQHVTAYLHALDLSGFNPKKPPPKTQAFWDIVNANEAPEDAELADVLDALGNPDVVTLAQLAARATGSITEWLLDRRHRRSIPHRMERCGYKPSRNLNAGDGLYKLRGVRQVIYTKKGLTPAEGAASINLLLSRERGNG